MQTTYLFIFIFIVIPNILHRIKLKHIFKRVDGYHCAASQSVELVTWETSVKALKHYRIYKI